MVDKNKDDFDDDLLDDLDDDTPAISKSSAIAEDKESAKSKLSKIFGKKKKVEEQVEAPETINDELTDSTPKV